MSSQFFSNSLFLLTGASSGMGLAIAEELAAKGASLIIASRSLEKLEPQKTNLQKLGAKQVEIVNFNMSEKDSSQKIIAVLGKRKINGLLLNAGGPKSGKITSLQYQDFQTANDLLVAGPINLLLTLIPHMENHNSSVVAITSTAVKEPVRELNLSAGYRTALVVLLKNLAYEVGSLGIRINNIGPGKIATTHLENMIAANAQKNDRSLDLEKKEWEACAALNRMGTPEEVAKLAVFLLSPDASFVNGQTILADGCSTKSYF